MHYFLLGSTGPSGLLVLQKVLALPGDSDNTVTVYVRSPNKLPDAIKEDRRVRIVQGELNDRERLANALQGVEVLISCLGPPTKVHLGLFWSDHPLANCYRLVFSLIQEFNMSTFKRAVVLGTPSIPSDRDSFSLLWYALVTVISVVAPSAYLDIVEVGQIVHRYQKDGLQITLARVPLLTSNSSSPQGAITSYTGEATQGVFLDREDLASWFVNEAASGEHAGQDPILFSR